MKVKIVQVLMAGCVLVLMTFFYITFVHFGTYQKGKYHKSSDVFLPILIRNITSSNSSLYNMFRHTYHLAGERPECVISSASNKLLDKHRHIIIIGAMSFIGSRLAVYFHERGFHVLAVEDLICVDNNDLQWYRWTELMKRRIPLQIIMLSKMNKLQSLLTSHSPQAIIYVPTSVNVIDRNEHLITSVYRNYMSLLMNLKKGIQFVLVSHAKNEIEKGWLTIYESFLSSLFFEQGKSIVRVTNVHGPWQDTLNTSGQWYIDDVGTVVHEALKAKSHFLWNMDLCQTFTKGKMKIVSTERHDATQKWLLEYNAYMTSGRTRNATLGAYLVSVSYVSQYGIFPVSDKFRYFLKWFTTAMSHKLSIVIFHDTMSKEFQSTLKVMYSKTQTVHIKPVSHMIANDQRFYFIYDYLLRSDDIHMAITTDIRDVEFLRNPAETMALIGSTQFFIGLDIPFYTEINSHGQANAYKRCYPNYPRKEVFLSHGVFNNGVLGGTRSTLLTTLIHMLLYMEDSTHVGNSCCDMPTIELLMHTKFFKNTFVGYPFNSAFFTQTPGPNGLTVRHKPS